MKRVPLIVSFLLFIALCASIAYWALQLFKPPSRPVAAPPRIAKADVSPDSAAVLFGGRPGKVAVASNYQLKGVILSGTSGDSVAILSADGKPAQAVGVNREVVPGVTVKEVHREYVLLSEGGAIKRVELPESAKMQVNLASTAPIGISGAATAPAPASPRAQLTPPPAPLPATQTATPSAATPAQPTGRSPLLPPPVPQGQQQAQTQGQTQSQTAPAVPATVVPGASPAVQTQAAPAGTVTQQPAAGANTTPAPTSAIAPANPSTIAPSVPARPVPGSSGASSEMLPPPTLQSR